MKKNGMREGWEFEELELTSLEIDQDIRRVWRLYHGGELIKEEFYYKTKILIQNLPIFHNHFYFL